MAQEYLLQLLRLGVISLELVEKTRPPLNG
nr:MAG TPA: hypothetical protein [Bacteriophage sp.]